MLALLLSVSLFGCQKEEEVILSSSEDYFDYASANMLIEAIPAQYDYVGAFYEGYAVVGKKMVGGMKYNYIDTQGNLLTDTWYDYADGFSEGLAAVGKKGQRKSIVKGEIILADTLFGYIDTTGKEVIPLQFHSKATWTGEKAFYHGYAEVCQYDIEKHGYGISSSPGSYMYNVIDKEGTLLFDTWCEIIGSNLPQTKKPFVNEYYLTLFDNHIDTDYATGHPWQVNEVLGRKKQTILFDRYDATVVFLDENGREQFRLNDCIQVDLNEYKQYYVFLQVSGPKDGDYTSKFGAVDTEGNILIPAEYDYLDIVDKEYIYAVRNNGGGLIDINENIVFPFGNYMFEFTDDIVLRREYFDHRKDYHYTVWNRDGTFRADLGYMYECEILRPMYEEVTKEPSWPTDAGYLLEEVYSEEMGHHNSVLYDYDGNPVIMRDGYTYWAGGFLISEYSSKDEAHLEAWKGQEKIFKSDTISAIFPLNKELYKAQLKNSRSQIYRLKQENGVYSFEPTEWCFDTIEQYEQYLYNLKQDGATVRNGESTFTIDPWSFTMRLATTDGEVLAESEKEKAFSLVENGFWLSANCKENPNYGYQDYTLPVLRFQYVLHKLDGSFTSEPYEYLGKMREGYLVYQKRGKYGYLKLEEK